MNSTAPVQLPKFMPDEELFRQARTGNELDEVNSVSTKTSLDINENYIHYNYTAEPETVQGPSYPCRKNIKNENPTIVGPSELQNELAPKKPGSWKLMHESGSYAQQTFREERQNLWGRIADLRNDLEVLNLERHEEEAKQRQTFQEMANRASFLSQELWNALQNNAALLDETAALKSAQYKLSARMNSIEEELQRLNVNAPDYKRIRDLLDRLERRETELKRQIKRLAQLDSYYTNELNIISGGSRRVDPCPVTDLGSSQAFIQYQYQTPPEQFEHRGSSLPIFNPGQAPLPANLKHFSSNSQPYACPKTQTQVPIPMPHETNTSSYIDQYYKTVTDKAIDLLKRETKNCSMLLHKYSETPVSTSTNEEDEIDYQNQKNLTQEDETKCVSTSSSDEEDILRTLFFKF